MLKADIYKELRGFTLNVKFSSNSKSIGILGASGCGKSMTLKSIAGIVTPNKGEIILNDKILYSSSKHINIKPQKRNAGYLFQDYALFPNMTVRQNILCSLKNKNEIDSITDTFSITPYADKYPHMLSGGQQQRAALARCIAQRPDIVLLDEPFSALDGFLKERLQIELKNTLLKYNKPSVIVTHDRDEAYRLCDEIMIMDNGKIIEHNKTTAIFNSPEYMITAKITGCKNIYDKASVKKLNFDIAPSKDINFIGIRAHDFYPANKGDKNSFRVFLSEIMEAPFEYNIIFKTENDLSLMWKANKSGLGSSMPQIPQYLAVKSDKILMLK